MKSILYRIRNGKSYSTETEEYNTKQKIQAKQVLSFVLNSLANAVFLDVID
ncbi:unnamed protein product [marine sediment metagenome]|uniref:Uncharacterized protein n=1 Tax=marine sediment metagenome TaxID=412755 RepID=X0YY17_9ZZZZ